MGAGAEVRIHSCTDGLGIAEVGDVCLLLWRAEVTAERFERQRTTLEAIVTHHAGRIALMCVVAPEAPPPGEPMRKASVEMVESLSARLSCVACVIEGSGFRAALTRSILSGMSLIVSKRLARIKFTAAVGDAAHWVEQNSAAAPAQAILRGYAALCAGLDEQAPRAAP